MKLTLTALLEAIRRFFKSESIHYIGGSDTLPPPLPREQEAEAIAALDAGDEDAKSRLIEHNLRLVVYIARRFENTGVNIEDLISIGTIGLIKAINTFNSGKSIKLATYASRCIENEILMYLRKNNAVRGEISIDEPLNTDYDGNELLLSDILGTDADEVIRRSRTTPTAKCCTLQSTPSPSAKSASYSCATALSAARSTPRRRWPACSAYRRAISRGWKNA